MSDRQSAQASSGAGTGGASRVGHRQRGDTPSVGALLRAERLAVGLSARALARATGCAPSTVTRLERGERHPRECLLRYLARALNPDDPRPLADRLVAAAGPSLRPDTDGWIRQRKRRADAALLAGYMPLPTELERRLGQHRQASAARARAMALLDQRGALNDPAVLAEAQHLLDEAGRLREEAGPPVTIYAGRHAITAGWGT